MRVGLLIYGALETISGGYLYDRKLVKYLRRQGDDVNIISLPWRNYVRHLGDNLSLSWLHRLGQLPLDVLLQDELNHPSFFLLNRWLRARVDYPIVSIVHHLRSSEERQTWQNRFYRWVERYYLSTVDGFVFNSQTTRRAVESLTGEERPAVMAYAAADHLSSEITEEEIAARARQPGPLRLIFLGNVIPRKGLHTLLSALSQLPGDDGILSVVGSLHVDKSYVRAIRHQVSERGLTERVQFLGALSDDALIARLRQSHLLVVPSSYEGFGIAYLEGIGFGLPAVATTAGAAGEIITHGRDGFLIPPGDTKTLALCLSEVNRDRDRLLAMSLAARQRYVTHPTWEETTKRIRTFLQAFVEK